ncbi:MAG: kynureninase [Anaerovoracaceae bacterium]|jgi:kynureninase
MRTFEAGREFAEKKDREDGLAPFAGRFYKLPGKIYMDGNSLGLMSRDAEEKLAEAVDAWKNGGIDIWGEYGYFLYHDKLGKMTAPLINADPDEVTVTGSTTVNVHQAVLTFYRPTKDRYRILVDDLNFPTDRYALMSIVRNAGFDPADALKTVKSRDGRYIYEDDIINAMTDDVCLVLLPSALYRSAQLIDMKKIADAAKERGIYAGFDLCHSIGVVPHDFKEIDPDFAVWCTYKYMNGGPGAVAGLYINRKHFGREPGLAGWWGYDNEKQFDLPLEFEHAEYAGGWQVGTSPILSMAPIEGSLSIIEEAGIDAIREKSLDITAYLMYLIDEVLAPYGFSVGNPREDERRTGHVALVHDDAIRINAAMKARGVIPDFRYPDVIRLAPVPLYTSYAEVYDMVMIIKQIMDDKEYEKFENRRGTVA